MGNIYERLPDNGDMKNKLIAFLNKSTYYPFNDIFSFQENINQLYLDSKKELNKLYKLKNKKVYDYLKEHYETFQEILSEEQMENFEVYVNDADLVESNNIFEEKIKNPLQANLINYVNKQKQLCETLMKTYPNLKEYNQEYNELVKTVKGEFKIISVLEKIIEIENYIPEEIKDIILDFKIYMYYYYICNSKKDKEFCERITDECDINDLRNRAVIHFFFVYNKCIVEKNNLELLNSITV